MEMKSPQPCPNIVTVRRNPPRKARATPSASVPLPMPRSSSSIPQDIPSFPIQDILSIQVPQNPNSDLSNSQSSSSSEVPLSENFKVFLRIRPLTSHLSSEKHGKNGAQKSRTKNAWPQNPTTKNASKTKIKKKSEICITVNDSNSVTLRPPPAPQDVKRIKSEVYEGFSHVFAADSSQCEVYEKMVNPLVEDFMRGKSGMLVAMGPSGSGKTHTVFGCPREPGMVPLALRRIFSLAQDSGIQSSRSFYLSMFEINSERGKAERMVDLSQDGGDLCLQQSVIKGLQEVIISDVQQAESLIARGMLKRATAMTNSNNQSSRSQCIINIRSAPNKMDGEVDVQSRSAVLTIVDLAGAEREKKTGNQGARLLESNFINNTSMVFGLCLRSLLDHQKNPKKPLQKHFQSSLLTRYLRDYMEGKKRMALILTVKSGEDDYVDTSFLLRQASPYMKIKFNNVEMLDSLCNKRHIHMSRREQLKRMKFSSLEACAIGEGKDAGDRRQVHKEELVPEQVKEVEPLKVLDHFPRIINLEETDCASVVEDCIEYSKRDRENQIMHGFAKALWNVLKQYKNKLEVAENEIQSLRESLANEKDRCSDLENEMRNLKSCCSCGKEVSAEVSLIKVDSRTNASPELERCQSTDVNEVLEIQSLRKSLANEKDRCSDLENEIRNLKSCCSCEKEVSAEVSLVKVDSRTNASPELERCQSTDVNEVSAGDSSLNLKKSECIDSDQRCDATASNSDVVVASCLGVEKFGPGQASNSDVVFASCLGVEKFGWAYQCIDQKHKIFNGNVDIAKVLKNMEDMGREDTCTNDDATDSGHSESVVSSSESLVMISDDSCSSVVENQLQDEEDKTWLDEPVMPKEDAAFAQGCDDCNAPEDEWKLPQGCEVSNVPGSELKLISCSKPWKAEKPKRLVGVELKEAFAQGCDDGNAPEDESKLPQGCEVSNVPGSEQKLISCSKPWKAEKPKRLVEVELKEDVAFAQGCDDGNAPEDESKLPQGCDASNVPGSEQKLISCSKPQKAEKPKRLVGVELKEDEAFAQGCDDGNAPEDGNATEDESKLPQGCDVSNVPESEQKLISCSKLWKAEKPKRLVGVELKEDVAFARGCDDSNAPEDESKLPQGCDVSNVPGSEQKIISCSKLRKAEKPKRLARVELKEDVAFAQGCDDDNAPEDESKLPQGCDFSNVPGSEQKLISCSEPQKAEKPKRRLLPASSMSLKNTNGLDFVDENERPKGTKGEKKLTAADESKRTQGSIKLRHLLKTNLP